MSPRSCRSHSALVANKLPPTRPSQGCNNWELPPASCIPPSSQQAGDRAVRTPFTPTPDGAAVTLRLPEASCPERLVFVVHDTEGDVWIRDHSNNFSLPLRWGARVIW